MSRQDSTGPTTEGLSEAKRKLIQQRLRGLGKAESVARSIAARPADKPARLSPSQRGIWNLHQVDPLSAAYNINAAYWVQGSLDLDNLEESLDLVANRHQILRTSFEPESTDGVQMVRRDRRLRIQRRKVEAQDLHGLAKKLAREPFDLESGPLVRMVLIESEVEGDRGLLLLSSHHVILDEWSLKIFWDELFDAYRARVSDGGAEIQRLPIQFADYASWQHQRLDDGVEERQLEYWRRKLGEPTLGGVLPTDRPRGAGTSELGRYLSGSIEAETVDRLRALASRENASLSMVLLLGMNLLVQRYTGHDDILIGTPIADRQLPETSNLIGYFLNTVVLRTELDGDPTVREALGRVRQTMLEAFGNREVAFDRVVRELNPARPRASHPYFQTMFVYQRQQESPQAVVLPGATLEPVPINAGSAKFDLTLFAAERDGRVETTIEYKSDLFEPETIERMLGHYRVLLESIVSQPQARITDLSMLALEEEELVLRTWQGREHDASDEPLVHEAIARCASGSPASPAVIATNGESMTYAELQRTAAATARQLLLSGVESGELVALQMERSSTAIAAILGILEAGAAYLPVDPDYPIERRRFMLKDAGVRFVIASEERCAELETLGLRVITVPGSKASTSEGSKPGHPISPEHLAYVIYTSGSTGEPKGVVVRHENLRASNLARRLYYIDPPQRYLLLPSLSFDSSVAGLFWTLTSGGALVVPTEKEVRDPAALCRVIEQHQVTTLLSVPTLYRSILDAATGSQLESLQSVIVAGESCPADLVDLHRKRSEAVPLFNEYGPTEASVWATVHRCVGDDTQGLVPIGRPIANTKALLLDAQKRPVPPLVVGQIYIAGRGVAAGYLHRDELTRERFVALELPGSEKPTRAYATGDLGRWRSDGSIEFLGRNDDQVKVSGFRIELAEIEAALRSHPAVEETAVSMVTYPRPSAASDSEQDASENRIVGFYRIRETTQSPVSSSELRQYLAEKLPVFMLPTSLIELSELPRQPNGKLDRIALAERARTAVAKVSPEPPANAVEAQLMRLWLELIEVASIDRHSNFFELGGHSLLIPSLIERVHQDFDVELPLGVIFEAPTIAELARVVEAGNPRDSWKSLVSIRSGGDRQPLYLVHGLAGEISYFYNLVRYLEPNRPVYGLQAPAAPFDQMEPMASHYLQEIRQVQPEGPYLLGGYCLGGCVAYEMARQLVEAGDEVQVLALFNSVPPRHIIGDSAPLTTILARRLKRFASKGPKDALASLTNLKKIKGHFERGLGDDRQAAEVTLDDLITGMHAAYRAPASCHYRALRDYRPKKYPGDAWLFRGPDLYLGADFGWKTLIEGELEIEAIEGHHETVLKEPNVRGAAEKLSAVLDVLN